MKEIILMSIDKRLKATQPQAATIKKIVITIKIAKLNIMGYIMLFHPTNSREMMCLKQLLSVISASKGSI